MSLTKKKLREQARLATFKRDGYRCRKCGKHRDQIKIYWPQDLEAHHMVDRSEDEGLRYSLDNLISLCPDCHRKAEFYHSSTKLSCWEGYHPDDLKNLIKK